MSGFAGIVRIEPGLEWAEADRAAIARMAERIAFRGLDARQQWSQDGASFAFSLLTTGPAPQAVAQPVTLDGETWFLGEARCDGRDELIRRLEQQGVSLSHSVTSEQLVLHVFSRFGETGLAELDGDFSFVLWKPRERRLLAFRDLSGLRPFFYSYRDGVFCFSNTMQAVAGGPNVSRGEYDLQFIADFLLGSPHQDSDRTVYRDVRRLPAGCLLDFSAQGLSVRRVVNLPIEEMLTFKRDEEVLEEFRRLFAQAIGDRLPESDTSILLSGGLDSTSIAATAVAERKSRSTHAPLQLRALTLNFQPLLEDEEGPVARRFAEAAGLPFELLHVAHILPCDGMDKSPLTLPEPFPWPYWEVQPFYLSRVQKNSRVMLTGDAGDEILRGQGGPYLRYLSSRSGSGFGKAASALLRYIASRRELPALGAGIRSNFSRLLGRPAPGPAFPPWLTVSFKDAFGLRERFVQITAKPTSTHPFNPWSYAKLNGYLAPMMEAQDSTWTGIAVECRAPFLDRRLLRFLLRLPPIPWYMEKDLLRRAQKGVLPEEIRLRPKAPLQHDPLLLQMAAGKWLPKAPEPCPAPLRGLVNWPQLQGLLRGSTDATIYVHLRPLMLALWLKAVENGESIQ